MRRAFPIAAGVVAAIALLASYLVIVTLVEGRTAASRQLQQDLPFLAFLIPSFGLVISLIFYARELSMAHSGALAGTSGGMSATAVVACCAHLLPTLLPLVGFSVLANLLAAWKEPLLVVAIVLNLGVASYMWIRLRPMRRRMASAVSGVPAMAPQAAAPPRFACPMHPAVQSDWPTTCSECGMALERTAPVSTAPAWTCPMHPEVVRDHDGSCPTCGMALERANRVIGPKTPPSRR